MKYLLIPDIEPSRKTPAFYFAVEEYVATHFDDDEYFFIWSVQPCLMVGRNQLIENEINEVYCREHSVGIFRRKSGGGCVYADMGCLQFSYVVNRQNVEETFKKCIGLTASALRAAGIPAETTGRNDILVDGKKVAGAAFYTSPVRNVMHNTLLYNGDLNILQHCITTDKKKFTSKGVPSLGAKVTNVKGYTPLSIDEVAEVARREVCGNACRRLTVTDIAHISELEKNWLSEAFIRGKNPPYTLACKHRFPDVGVVEAYVSIRNFKIEDIRFGGDFFPLSSLEPLCEALHEVEFSREAVEKTLAAMDVSMLIRGLDNAQLVRLLFGREPHVAKPEWLRTSMLTNQHFGDTQAIIHEHRLHTICESGLCPNRNECWRNGTATFMIGGDVCTRCCRFCNTKSGHPLPLDKEEPLKVAQSIRKMHLRYAVITSVDRDDLPDYGARHWAETVRECRRLNPETGLELLIPDFRGHMDLIEQILDTEPDVVGHNMETVRRLTPSVRSVATYDGSLDVLRIIAKAGIKCKTGMMLGLGETRKEVLEAMDDILATGCSILTLGQYLQPTARHLPVKAYITPQEFEELRSIARSKGFAFVESAPLVRSSYHAEQVIKGNDQLSAKKLSNFSS